MKDGKLLVKMVNGKAKLCSTCCNVMASECEWCVDTQPEWIDITLTGFSDWGCCDVLGLWQDEKTEGVASAVNNNTYRILHSSGCVYETIFSEDFGTYSGYSSSDGSCDPLTSSYSITKMKITITLTETGIDIEIQLGYLDGIIYYDYLILFRATDDYGEGEGCDIVERAVSNTLTECYHISPNQIYPCESSGVVTIAI